MPKKTDKLIMHGPVEVELKIRFQCEDNTATVTWTMPAGRYPTPKEIETAITLCQKHVEAQLGKKLAPLSREIFEQEIMMERTGTNIKFAASSLKWDKP